MKRVLPLIVAVIALSGSAATFPADDAAIVHVLSRTGFGPRPGDVERVKSLGLQRYIDEQLHPERIPDSAIASRLAGLTTLGMSSQQIAQDGQRIFTFLIYLNEGFEGGETDFPLIGLRHQGRIGDALFFWNVKPTGAVDRDTLHAGLPPATGQKWLFSQWVRDRPA